MAGIRGLFLLLDFGQQSDIRTKGSEVEKIRSKEMVQKLTNKLFVTRRALLKKTQKSQGLPDRKDREKNRKDVDDEPPTFVRRG